MKFEFDNKIALVTGASRGIGRAIAIELASCGIKVICVSKNIKKCHEVVDYLKSKGYEAEAEPVDVSNSQSVKEASIRILKKYGCVDILVNNAGITRDGLVLRLSDDDWDDVIRTNLNSCFYWVKNLSLPMMQKRWGRIINITSVVGIMGNIGQANYSSSKAGVIGLTKSLARELAKRNITVNAIAPGFIKTNMTSSIPSNIQDKIINMIPLRRMGKVDDISSMVAYLSSNHAEYITGQTFAIDGGMSI